MTIIFASLLIAFGLLQFVCTVAQATLTGRSNLFHSSSRRKKARIIGGTNAAQGQYRYYTLWAGCGATLIYPDIILSAAHCNTQGNTLVRIGAYNKTGWQDGSIVRAIVNRTVHPLYNGGGLYDFLVMKIDSNATQTPIPLNSNPLNPVVNQSITTIGLGTINASGFDIPTILQQVTVNYVDDAICAAAYGSNFDSAINFCAAVPEGGKDSCSGDSGGPIIDSLGYQVGIVSFGSGCAQAAYPGVYARVSFAIDWINQQICNLSAYPPLSCPPRPTPAPQPPTASPTVQPTTASPTVHPTAPPTRLPTSSPVAIPTRLPTKLPTRVPTRRPTVKPTRRF